MSTSTPTGKLGARLSKVLDEPTLPEQQPLHSGDTSSDAGDADGAVTDSSGGLGEMERGASAGGAAGWPLAACVRAAGAHGTGCCQAKAR